MWATHTLSATQRRLSVRRTTSALEIQFASRTVTRKECAAASTLLFGRESTASWLAETARPRTHAQRTRSVFSPDLPTVSASAPKASLLRSLGFAETSTSAKKSANGHHVVPMPSAAMRVEATSVCVHQGIQEIRDKAALPFVSAAGMILIVRQMKSVFMDNVSVSLRTSWKVTFARILVLGFSAASMRHVPSHHWDRSASVTLAALEIHRLAAGM